jgi:hypothetical protein
LQKEEIQYSSLKMNPFRPKLGSGEPDDDDDNDDDSVEVDPWWMLPRLVVAVLLVL